jgi:hypothetical protein
MPHQGGVAAVPVLDAGIPVFREFRKSKDPHPRILSALGVMRGGCGQAAGAGFHPLLLQIVEGRQR